MQIAQRKIESIVSAVVYAVVDQYQDHGSFTSNQKNEITRIVLLQLNSMPDYLRFPLRLLILLANTYEIFCGHGSLLNQTPEARLTHLRKWMRSPLSPLRDLARLFESLVVVILFDGPTLRRSHEIL